jgi:phage terminase large subunit GpA-like protein
VLILTGANSAVGLRSMPARYLFLDEVDGYPGDVEGEGDPILLAERRSATFQRRKILLVSTPKTKGLSRIERVVRAERSAPLFRALPALP